METVKIFSADKAQIDRLSEVVTEYINQETISGEDAQVQISSDNSRVYILVKAWVS